MAWSSFSGIVRWPVLAALALPFLWAQISANYLTVGQVAKIAGKRNTAAEVKIPCAVQDGFHVNSNTPAEDYLIPLKVTWNASNALQAGSVTYPKAEEVKYLFADKPLSVFTGKFDLVAHFKIAPNAPAGSGIATGKLRYQACNDRACYPPKTVDISVSYLVQ